MKISLASINLFNRYGKTYDGKTYDVQSEELDTVVGLGRK